MEGTAAPKVAAVAVDAGAVAVMVVAVVAVAAAAADGSAVKGVVASLLLPLFFSCNKHGQGSTPPRRYWFPAQLW